jgi:hypothetical protein
MRLVPVVVTVLVLAGCGGSSSSKPTTTAPDTPQARALTRYVDAVRVQYVRFGVLSQEVLEAIRTIDVGRPDRSWDRAARRLAKAATGFRRLASALAAMHVPKPLSQAHFRLAEGVGIFAQYIDGVRAALQVGIPSALASAAGGNVDRALASRPAWGKAVQRYAETIHTTLPAWVTPLPSA